LKFTLETMHIEKNRNVGKIISL